MKRVFQGLIVLGLATAAACHDSNVTEPSAPVPDSRISGFGAAAERDRDGKITVMTQNMYVGADVDAVIGALATPDPNDDIPTLLGAIQTLGQTDYPTRARAFARTIARERPHIVGLQEVSVIDLDLTALGLPVVIHLDFLATLEAELAARGLNYTMAAQVKNIVAGPLPGVQLVDYDAMLVDAERVTVLSAQGRNFSNNLGVVAPGVELKRGWVSAELVIGGKRYSVASTHLESGDAPGLDQLRAAQALELIASLPTGRPSIVMGDLNDSPGSPMYQAFSAGGFADVWKNLRPGQPGFTCCEPADLSNPFAQLTRRFDFLWVRTGGRGERELDGQIERIGEQPKDKVAGPAYPIWPSDHAGLLMGLKAAEGWGRDR